MGDFGFAVGGVGFVVAGSYGEHKIPRMTLALSDQEAAVFALLRQQLLGFAARKVTVKPPGRMIRQYTGKLFIEYKKEKKEKKETFMETKPSGKQQTAGKGLLMC